MWAPFNPDGFLKGYFLLFSGYIDESYDADYFVLSSSIARGGQWSKLSKAWGRYLRNVNKKLRREGRTEISEYKASSCGGLAGEFKGWTQVEQIEFTKNLIRIIHDCSMESVVYVLNLKEHEEVFGFCAAESRRQGIYFAATQFCMQGMSERARMLYPPPIITLFHDHSDYDCHMLDAFNIMKYEEGYGVGHYFSTIAPLDSKQSKPIQVADLIAYEALNEIRRQEGKRKGEMKKSLQAMLASTSFGVSIRTVPKEFLERIRDYNLAQMGKGGSNEAAVTKVLRARR